jgi:hypothetical protein
MTVMDDVDAHRRDVSRRQLVVAAPDRSLEQRMAALKNANVIRVARAQLKRDLKAGRVSILDVILDPPEWMESAKVFDFLLATPKYGRVKVNKVFVQCRISPSKTIGGLSERQRGEIVGLLGRLRRESEAGREARMRARARR